MPYLTQVNKKKAIDGNQRWSRGHNAQGQGYKKNPRPRTQTQAFSKKKGRQKFFSDDLQNKRSSKNFSGDIQNFNDSKNSAVLEPRNRQFSRTRGFKAKDLTSKPRTSKCVLEDYTPGKYMGTVA